MAEWKPISEAPRGPCDVLVFCEDTREMMVAFWSTDHRGWQFACGPRDGAHICTPDWYCDLPEPPETVDATS